MDIPREPKGHWRRYVLIGAGALALILITVFLAGLDPAAPSVERDTILIGTVERGPLVREVRGPGVLVPEQIRYVSALTAGRVDEVLVQPGETVTAETVLLRLGNPDVELEALQAQQQVTEARAALIELRRSLASERATQQATVASVRAQYLEAVRQAEADSALAARQLVPVNDARRSSEQADALAVQLRAEEERLRLIDETAAQQIAVQEEQVRRLESIHEYQRRRVASMNVTAGAAGVVQDLALEVGQWVQSGTTLARVAQPGRLQAEVRIPQIQAREVQIGQVALVDTRADTIRGRVARIDPNVQNGSVLVEIRLEGELPSGARPDLSVDGTIQIERLADVLHVERPAYGQAHSTVGLFKLVDGGEAAVRTTVRLGASSVSRIEVVEGLAEGDRMILSDMSRFDDVDRVRIE